MKKYLMIFIIIGILVLGGNVNAKEYGYGIPKSQNNERPYPGKELEDVITKNNGIYIGPDTKEIYLSFDCGYENGYTNMILDTLKETNTKAIFFITGHYLTSATDIVKRMINEGHIVGNHSYNHKNFAKISQNEIKEELERLEKKYKELTGKDLSKYVRPPEGVISDSSAQYISSLGYKNIFWSLAYVDWHKDKSYGKEYSINNVMSRIHNGAIILMHTVSKDNALGLKDIIEKCENKGYIFSSIAKVI